MNDKLSNKLPENMRFCDAMEVSVGELNFTTEDVTSTGNFTILTFELLLPAETISVAIPMGTEVGNLFYTGELFMHIRELWNDWFELHPPPTEPEEGLAAYVENTELPADDVE